MKFYAMRYARYAAIEDYLRQGWIAPMPNSMSHHHHYGIELAWICSCPVPGGFKTSSNRVSSSQTEGAEHDTAGRQPA